MYQRENEIQLSHIFSSLFYSVFGYFFMLILTFKYKTKKMLTLPGSALDFKFKVTL